MAAAIERGRRAISFEDVPSNDDLRFKEVDLFGFRLSRTGLRPIEDGKIPSEKNWQRLGDYLSWMEGALQWLIGDWLVFGEANYREKVSQAVDASGWDLKTVKQYEWVAKEVPANRRDPDLSFFHHRAVAKLAARDQRSWLKRAKEESWNVEELSRKIQIATSGKRDTSCWLLVSCPSMRDRDRLIGRLEKEGRSCKIP